MEIVLVIPLFILIISFTLWFARVLITKQQLVTAARYGTDMILYTTLNEKQIKKEIRNYLSDTNIEGRKLDPAGLPDENIAVKIEGFVLPDFSSPYDLLDPGKLGRLLDAGNLLAFPERHTSWVEIHYEFRTPRVVSNFSRYFSGGFLPESITISGRSEVLAGTGCGNGIHGRQ
ncbi:MAG: TadE family protein [Elusimicrobiota bacterium]